MVNNKISVNGPVHVTRLEGGIGNTKKVIYLFLDIHMDPDFQTECNNINSVDIKNYFIDNFNKISDLDKTYDFLFEMKPTLLSKKSTPVKGRYIDQVVKLFKKEFKINHKLIVSKSSALLTNFSAS